MATDVPDPGDRPRARDRRDRHGRGMRSPLAPPPVPLARTRREQFEDLVGDAFDDVADAVAELGRELQVVVVVIDVPPPGRVHVDEGDLPVVDLGDLRRAGSDGAEVDEIRLYRRPIEARSLDDQELTELVHDVVVELAADLLGIDPGDLSPDDDDDEEEEA